MESGQEAGALIDKQSQTVHGSTQELTLRFRVDRISGLGFRVEGSGFKVMVSLK